MLFVNVLSVPDDPDAVALVKLPDTTNPALVDEVLVSADVKSMLQLLIVLKSALLVKCTAKLLVTAMVVMFKLLKVI